jgi:hypothetical protein
MLGRLPGRSARPDPGRVRDILDRTAHAGRRWAPRSSMTGRRRSLALRFCAPRRARRASFLMRARPRRPGGRLVALCSSRGAFPPLCSRFGGLPALCFRLPGLRAGVFGRAARDVRPLQLRQNTVALTSVVEQNRVSQDRCAERPQRRVRAVDPELRRRSGTCAVVAHQARRAVQREPSHPQIAVDQGSRNSTQVQQVSPSHT